MHYPHISLIKKRFRRHTSTSSSNEPSKPSSSSSNNDSSNNSITSTQRKLNVGGVNRVEWTLLLKENELFRVDIKSVPKLEVGLSPSNISKKTDSLFLDKVDNMTAYPCYSSHKAEQGLGDFVEAVSDLNQSQQSHEVDTGVMGGRHRNRTHSRVPRVLMILILLSHIS